MKIELKKLKNYEEVAVKALLDSGTTRLFIDTQFAKRKEFKLKKLKNSLLVRNIDRTMNIERTITHQVEYNIFFKRYIERVRINVCNLEKLEVILGILQLAAHNLEIYQKKEEVEITRCLLIYRRRKQKEKRKEIKKTKKKEIIKELVPKKFWK